MRVEVFDEGNGCDEFLFGSYHDGEVDGNFDKSSLEKVHAALTEQLTYVDGLLEQNQHIGWAKEYMQSKEFEGLF